MSEDLPPEEEAPDDLPPDEDPPSPGRPVPLDRDPLDSLDQRCKTSQQRRSAESFRYCRTPTQAKEIVNRRSATSRSLEASEMPASFFNPKEIYYRDRDQMEQARKRKFEADNQHRYALEQIHSPYRYRILKHHAAVDKRFKRQMAENEETVMRDRYRATMRYRKAVNESWEHEAKLVKEDHFSIWYPALRILSI
jgi:hypothetical protein